MQGAPRRGRHDRARKLEPGYDHDGRGHRRCRLHRAAHNRGAGTHYRPGAPGRRAAHPWRSDRTQPRRRSGRRRDPRPIRRQTAWHAASDDPERRGPGAVPESARRYRRAGPAIRDRRVGRRRIQRPGRDRTAPRDPARLHPGRHGRRDRRHTRRVRPDRPKRDRRQPDQPGAHREVPGRVEGDRVRGDAGRRRQLHHNMQYGEYRPDGRPHGGQHRCRSKSDAD